VSLSLVSLSWMSWRPLHSLWQPPQTYKNISFLLFLSLLPNNLQFILFYILSKEPLLKGKAQYRWSPSITNLD